MTNPYREAPARDPEDAFPTMTGEALTRTAQQYGLNRKPGETDEALRERMRAFWRGGYPPMSPKEWAEILQQTRIARYPTSPTHSVLNDRPRQSPIVSMTRIIVVDDGPRPFPPSAIPARDPLGE